MTVEDTTIERPHHDYHRAGQDRVQSPSRRRRVRRIPSLWLRLAALTVFLAVVLVVIIGLTLKAVRPYQEAVVESCRLAATRRQVADYARRNAILQRQIAYLNTPNGIASAGHSIGYFRPNEIPLVIEGMPIPTDASASDGPASPADPIPGPAPLVHRFWNHLRDF